MIASESWGAAARVIAAALPHMQGGPVDTVVVESPLPGGAAQFFRFLFNEVPQWVQIGGVFVGAAVGAWLAWLTWRRRDLLLAWYRSRPNGVRLAVLAAGVTVIAGSAGTGAATWNYMEHNNAFCTGCHVMNPAFSRFSAGDNKHGDLSCHACHQQSIFASTRQLYQWVAERPEMIGTHSRVPNERCAGCHVTSDTARWQRVAATAGHRVHLESDSSALADIQCVSCHGAEVHRFEPANQTCGQSGCHAQSETNIVLGRMGAQTVLHCAGCHGFTADVPALATRDSARGTLVPGDRQCLGCHEMRSVLADFDPVVDPHGGKCGSCHNPHTQRSPSAAAQSCASSGCHANWRDEPFHTGPSHRRVGGLCLTCHVPHSAKVDASNCEGCHQRVREAGTLRPPVQFDTTSAMRRPETASFEVDAARERPGGPSADGEAEAEAAMELAFGASMAVAQQRDTFPHPRHARLACIECHTTGAGHGGLTFEQPRGCAICHHQAPSELRCPSCHRAGEYDARPAVVTVAVPRREPRPRGTEFRHAAHVSRVCTECHTTPVSMAPAAPVRACTSCHENHHREAQTCSTCHALANPAAEHRPVQVAHQRCDACHTGSTIRLLTPTRSLCAVCHATKAREHYDTRECTVCHFLAEPSAYRAQLVTQSP